MSELDAVKSAFEAMPSFKDFAKAAGKDLSAMGDGIRKGTGKAAADVLPSGNDFVEIPVGTKTLLGEDFSVLARTSGTYSRKTDEGHAEDFLKPNPETEMRSGNLASSKPRSLESFTPEKRAAFEVVLLSKKYASMYEEGDREANDRVAYEYTDYMSQYRVLCERDGTSWDEVMNYASWELQQQSYEYGQETDTKWFSAGSSDAQRVECNRAHGMLIKCGSEGWQDTKYPALGDMDYESMSDLERRDVGFLSNVGRWFSEKWDKIKGFLTAPWRGVKSAAKGLLAADAAADIDEALESGDRKAVLAAAEWGGKVSDFVDGVDGTSGDGGKDRYAEAVATLGGEDVQPEAGGMEASC